MDKAEYVGSRKRKYMAQTLEHFEQRIEPHLGPELAGAVQDFKGLVRARFNALATDSVDIMSLSDAGAVNGAALDLRDQLSPTGRP
jgi:hypothetical protein